MGTKILQHKYVAEGPGGEVLCHGYKVLQQKYVAGGGGGGGGDGVRSYAVEVYSVGWYEVTSCICRGYWTGQSFSDLSFGLVRLNSFGTNLTLSLQSCHFPLQCL